MSHTGPYHCNKSGSLKQVGFTLTQLVKGAYEEEI